MDIATKKKLNNGIEIPILGLGVWKAGKETTVEAVKTALEAGYRHIDTAAIYGNEREVGKGIQESGIERKQIFITTKLWNDDQDNPEKAFETSMEKLGVDYIDLYLIHWPIEKKRENSWKVLEKLYEKGLCRAIGVSNYTEKHIEELKGYSSIIPAVNQVEFHAYLYQKNLMDYCNENRIALEAYSPLTHGKRINDPKLAEIAGHYGKTPAQLLIHWVLEKGAITMPKSTRKNRIIENSMVFDFRISAEDMKQMDSLNENLRTCWNPYEIP